MSDTRAFRIAVDGRALEAAWWGPAADPAAAIVLLHEGLGCVALWRDFPERLVRATGLGVFAYSRFGYGRSDPAALPRPVSYMHDEARRLGRVLDAAGVRRCVLLGHSDGASIAAIYAGTARDARVRGLVLIAPHFFVEEMAIASIAAARAAYRNSDLRERLARYHADPDNAFCGWNDAWLDPAFRDWRIDDVLPAIAAPMLILQGTEDEYGSAEQLRIAERKAGGKVQTAPIEGAGHSPHISAPDVVMQCVVPFVRSALPLGAALTPPSAGSRVPHPAGRGLG